MADPNAATINARGQVFTGWESVLVRRDFGNGVSFFEFTAAEQVGSSGASLQLFPGDPVTVALGGEQVINGHVTTRSVAMDDRSRQVVIAGRSFTADVADSSVPLHPGSYDGSTMAQAARGVLAPHKVGLVVKNPPAIFSKPFGFLRTIPTERVADFINRMASVRGVFVSDDAQGNLVLHQGDASAAPVAELREGDNILRLVGIIDDQTAFSKYGAISQVPDPAADAPPGASSATATDNTVRANRTTLAIGQHPGGSDDMVPHAGLQAARSGWSRVNCTITVAGWRRPDGALWQPANNVSLNSKSIFGGDGTGQNLGILSVTYAQNSQEGTTTTLELVLTQFLTSNPTAGLKDIPAPGAAPSPSVQTKADAPDWSANI